MKQYTNQSGIASLPIIIILLSVVMLMAAVMASLAEQNRSTSADQRDSGLALSFAKAGAEDALLAIARDKNFNQTYQLALVENGCSAPLNGCVNVSVDVGSSPKKITARGQYREYVRIITAEPMIDVSGAITSINWQQQ
ncbi:MAG: hypothetical protein WCK11_04130 [Candidatus Falkowbacteria bacterium]